MKCRQRRRIKPLDILLAAICAVSLTAAALIGWTIFHQDAVYRELSIDAEADAGDGIDWDGLRARNPDIAAWVSVETQSVPKAYCPSDAATKVSDVAGHTSLTTQTAGNSISLSSIQASSSPARITSAIEDGHVAIALSLDSSKSLSPLLRVGDRVNVMAVVSDGTTSSAETVCANVKIVALDSALSGSPDAGYSLVTLDVTEDQAAAIVANPNVTLTAIPQTAEGASDAE